MNQYHSEETKRISIWLRLLLLACIVNIPILIIYYSLDGSAFDTQRFIVVTTLYVPIMTLVSLALYMAKY